MISTRRQQEDQGGLLTTGVMLHPNHPNHHHPLKLLFYCAISSTVAWWLFADTVRRHSPSDASGVALRFSHFGTYQDYELWRDVIQAFELDHPALTVHQEYVVGFSNRYDTKMRQQIIAGTQPDVSLIQLGPFNELGEHFADISDVLWTTVDDASSSVINSEGMAAFRIDGVQRGLPVSGGNLLIFCNSECFDRAARFHGRPIPRPSNDWNLSDFRRTAELLTCDFDRDGRIDQFGFWLPRWVYYLPFLWSFGAELMDDSHSSWKLVGSEAENAMSFYQALTTHPRVCPQPEEVPQLFQDTGFLTGRVAMCINGPWFIPFLKETKLADNYFVLPTPIGPAGRFTRITWDGVVVAGGLTNTRLAAVYAMRSRMSPA